MAIIVETLVPHASKDDAERFNGLIEQAMMQAGGPPTGLMVHITRQAGDGFQLSNVWRSEAEMRPFYDQVILPALAESGLAPEESAVHPVWALARP